MTQIDPQHLRLLEAILFASAEPVSERALAARLPEDTDLKELLRALEEDYADRGIHLVRAGRSWAFRTAPDLVAHLSKAVEVERKLSRAAVETLSIIAYHQPVTRGEIEEVRGVSLSKGTLDVLLEAGWIKPRGRRQTPGRPLTWGTSDNFLDHFGLEDIRDLPGMEDLKAAGLLDSGPAISAYRTSGGVAESSEDSEIPGSVDGETGDLLADDPLDEGILDEPPEPLDPEEGVSERL